MDGFDISELHKKTPYGEFDYTVLSTVLQKYSKPRNIISRLLNQNKIVRVKKGVYVYGKDSLGPIYNREILANLIYGPSYISLEYALGRYGLIPERVETVTSMTSKKNKLYTTPVGAFSYRYLSDTVFFLGIERIKVDEARHILIASKEKCIIDILYQQKTIVSVKDVEMFLYDDLRIDRPQLGLLNLNKVRFIVKHYSHVGVLTLPKLIERARL